MMMMMWLQQRFLLQPLTDYIYPLCIWVVVVGGADADVVAAKVSVAATQ